MKVRKIDKVLLGLEISRLSLQPGERRTYRDLAAFVCATGQRISWQRIWQIEQQALRKIRAHLYREKLLEQSLNDHRMKR